MSLRNSLPPLRYHLIVPALLVRGTQSITSRHSGWAYVRPGRQAGETEKGPEEQLAANGGPDCPDASPQ